MKKEATGNRRIQIVNEGGSRSTIAVPLSSSVHPWEQQPEETAKAYAMFVRYRDQVPENRSVARVHREFGPTAGSLRQMEHYCAKWSWVARALEWDREQDRIQLKATVKKRQDMGERVAMQAQVYGQALLQPVQALLKEVRDRPDFLANLVRDQPGLVFAYLERFARAFEIVTKVERLARGEPESITQVNSTVHQTNVPETRDVASAILEDPDTAEATAGLLARLHRVG